MDTYQLRNEHGEVYAFEIPNWRFFSSRAVARYFCRCPGVFITRVRRLFEFHNDVHVQFQFQGELFEVWEPYGDNSRYWVGPSAEPQRRRESIDELESFVRRTGRGSVSNVRASLLSLLRVRNDA